MICNPTASHFAFGKAEIRKSLTLEGAKIKMKQEPKAVKENHAIIMRLETIKAELIKIKNQIS